MNTKKGFKDQSAPSSKPSDRASYSSHTAQQIDVLVNSSMHTLQYKNGIYYGQLTQSKLRNGVGFIIYDSGHILISKFCKDSIQGPFLYFDSVQNLCFYGKMQNQKLNGNCYVMSRHHHYLQQQFCKGVRDKGGYVFNKFRVMAFNNQNNTTQHKVVFSTGESQKNRNQVNGCLNFQPFLLSPTQFLSTYFSQEQQSKFKLYQMERNKNYFGFCRNNKPEGFGLIIIDQWPICYGNFANGILNGQGRVQQNKVIILDGIFSNNLLEKGWIINLKQKKLSLGTQVSNNQIDNKHIHIKTIDDKYFQIKQQFFNLNYSLIQKFRREQHLQSLNFVNSYITNFSSKIIPSFNHLYLQYLQNQICSEYIQQQTAQQNFIPSFISQIQQIQDRSRKGTVHKIQRQLIQLIKQHNQEKKVFLQNSKLIEQKLKRDSEIYESVQKKDNQLKNLTKQFRSKQKINKQSPQKIKNTNTQKKYLNLKSVPQVPQAPQVKNTKNKITQNKQQKINSPSKLKTSPTKNFNSLQQNNPHERVTIEKKLNLHTMYNKYLRT